MDTLTLGLIIGGVLLFVLLCLAGVLICICCCGNACDASGMCPGFGGGQQGGVVPASGQTIIVQQPAQNNNGFGLFGQQQQEPKNDDRWLVLLDDRPRVRTPPAMPAPPPIPPPPFPPPIPPVPSLPMLATFPASQPPFFTEPARIAPRPSIAPAPAPARPVPLVNRQGAPPNQYKNSYNYKKDADSSNLIKSNTFGK